MDPIVILAMIWFLATPLFFVWWLLSQAKLRRQAEEVQRSAETHQHALTKINGELAAIRNKYAGIISQEAEVSRLSDVAAKLTIDIMALRCTYAEKRALLDRLEEQVAIYDERIAFAELGVYEPHFEFTDSEAYKAKTLKVRDRQKAMISAKQATICPTEWSVEGSKSKGATMINRQTRLTMRAFNNECEAAIANARWNNVVAMEKKTHPLGGCLHQQGKHVSEPDAERSVRSAQDRGASTRA